MNRYRTDDQDAVSDDEFNDLNAVTAGNRRIRRSNFTNWEKSLLVQLVQEHITKTRNAKLNANGWLTICKRYNSNSHIRSQRDHQQLRKCWNNVRERTRKDVENGVSVVPTQDEILPGSRDGEDKANESSLEWESLPRDIPESTVSGAASPSIDNSFPSPCTLRQQPVTNSDDISSMSFSESSNNSLGIISQSESLDSNDLQQEVYRCELQKLRTGLMFLRQEHELKMETMQLQKQVLGKIEGFISTKGGVSLNIVDSTNGEAKYHTEPL